MAASPIAAPPDILTPAERVDPGRWLLDPTITFLNHGSFGARTRSILDRQQVWRDRVEARPIEMLGRRVRELLAPSKEAVASFVGADPEGLGFVTNATEAVNAALRSVPWRRGDRIVTTDHVYHAVRQTLRRLAHEHGLELVEVPVPLPLRSDEEVLAAIEPWIASPTRLVLVDHVTSATAIRFPVESIVSHCRERSIEVIVDGAHAPGMIDLDVASLDPDHYAANLHKWVCAPLGTAFLWSSRRVRDRVHPNVTSHFYREGFGSEFDWQGTRDISGWIVAKDAIEDLAPVGWDRIRAHNHALATWAHAMLVEQLDVEPMSPLDGSLLGSMAVVEVPTRLAERFDRPEDLQKAILDLHSIELPVIDWGGRRFVRISAMVHNRPHQYERLAEAIRSMAT
ncbi:MAG: aminotransferase class V-fold PLP-dependent enzyme [Phycisphaerales bacterium]